MLERLCRWLLPVIACLTLAWCFPTDAQVKKKRTAKRAKSATPIIVANFDRRTVEANLLNGKFDHDQIGTLIDIGTIESVPALLRVLEHFKLSPSGSMICTRGHALVALARITGQNLGSTYEAWAEWWEANSAELLRKEP